MTEVAPAAPSGQPAVPRPALGPLRPAVYFIGAGPGDPDLLTVRGRRIIENCDVLIWADSLVHPAVRALAPAQAEVYGSSGLTLEELLHRMRRFVAEGKVVARVHSGDPSIFGALHEQLAALRREGIPFEVVPGVSSAMAAAAALGLELTVPGLAQTVIFTRVAGRTPVPEREGLQELARHRATLVLFLSAAHLSRTVQQLQAGGYPPDTPVVVAYRLFWEDQRLLRGTLATISARVRQAGIRRQALVMVGDALAPPDGPQEPDGRHRSHLYRPDYSHLFRRGRSLP